MRSVPADAPTRSQTATPALVLAALMTTISPGLAARAQDAAPSVDPSLFAGLEYRNVGPHRGGRATAVTGVPSEPFLFYFGSTGGGVWRTEDAGVTWTNLTDGQIGAGGIGAIAVAPSDPNVIYVGTGSACIRGNVSPGVGAYRSVDAGRTWSPIGLEHAGQIGKIVVHPNDPDLVYVAAMGNAFGPNEERGVFRSKDGGATWEKVLFADRRSGAVDLSMDAANPRVLYAGIWGGGERKSWDILSGSESGGVYKTTDGGDTWQRLGGGLPGGRPGELVGKVGVAVSPADSNRVWALVEHERGGLYRSDDAGATWRLINEDHMLWERPWYYMHVIADPRNENVVWIANVVLFKSVDGGKTITPVMTPHPDNHGLWINPNNTDLLINVNDGGANVSLNGGRTWSSQRNQATAELYRVTVDNQFPYRLYGAQQDNSTISVPSRLPPGMASDFEDEFQFGGCESGHVAVDPRDPNVIYAGCYGGSITRYDRRTGSLREVVAYPQLQLGQERRDLRYRFQWNAPIRISPHDPDVLYHTSQFVHRSRDGGQTWQVISPDLTTNNPEHQGFSGGPITRDGTGVEVYGTVFAFEESPLRAGELWAGSDDGRVHLSRDAGESWTEVTPKGLPEGATVNAIDISRHAEGRVIVTAYRYREADLRPYAFLTDDYGKSWRSLADGKNGIPADHFLRVVREDPVRRGLLFAGSEFGIYVSFDAGRRWQSFQQNLPITPVTDLVIHEGDLVLSTQGRSFWILDDLTPLRVLDPERTGPWMADPRPAYRLAGAAGMALGASNRATDAPRGVHFDTFLPAGLEGDVTIEITDPTGKEVTTLSSAPPKGPAVPLPEIFLELARTFGISFGGRPLGKNPGHNRALWDLTWKAPELPKGAVIFGFLTGAPAVPGRYQATFRAGEVTETHAFQVLPDPRSDASQEEMEAQLAFLQDVGERLGDVAKNIDRIRLVRSQARAAAERVSQVLGGSREGAGAEGSAVADGDAEDGAARVAEVREAADALVSELTAIEQELVQTKSRSFEDPLNYPGKLTAQLAHLYTVVNSGSDAPPTAAAYERLADLDEELAAVWSRLHEVFSSQVPAFNELVKDIELPAIALPGD